MKPQLKKYEYQSCLSPYIKGLLQMKRDCGYTYNAEAYVLFRLDKYCTDAGLETPELTKSFLEPWMQCAGSEKASSRNHRVYCYRQLAIYMCALGLSAYIPVDFISEPETIPYILSSEDIIDFFDKVDTRIPGSNRPVWDRYTLEYKLIFRLYISLGLRNSEARNLQWQDVDLNSGAIKIIESKGDKTRIVYLPDDLRSLFIDYQQLLFNKFSAACDWVFPGSSLDIPLSAISVTRNFNAFWSKTSAAEKSTKKPTVHSLRYTYVVNRINSWMKAGVKVEAMMPYLVVWLGHSGKDETYYYFHAIEDSLRICQSRDLFNTSAIPEVKAYGSNI